MEFHKANKVFFIASVVVAIAAIGAGFFLLGSPWHQRKIATDNHRLQDLQQIANAAYNYVHEYAVATYPATTSTQPLPASLSDLAGATPHSSNAYLSTQDPATHQPYEYRVINPTHLELCATFETDNTDQFQGGFGYPSPVTQPLLKTAYPTFFWHHAVGHACFTFSSTEYPPYVPNYY